MTSREMYKEHILDLYKNPLNFGSLKKVTQKERKLNPLCGDDITIEILVDKNVISDVKFSGKGCALCIASASLLTETIKGIKLKEVIKFNKNDLLKLLEIPVGPVRLKCVLLPLEVLHKAVKKC